MLITNEIPGSVFRTNPQLSANRLIISELLVQFVRESHHVIEKKEDLAWPSLPASILVP